MKQFYTESERLEIESNNGYIYEVEICFEVESPDLSVGIEGPTITYWEIIELNGKCVIGKLNKFYEKLNEQDILGKLYNALEMRKG